MKIGIRSMAFCLALAVAAPALAKQGSTDPQEKASAEEQDTAGWTKRLDEAAARIVAARTEVARLEDAKGRGAARRYPRGDAKEKYLDALAKARTELDEAEQALPALLEEARSAGVEPGVLDRYENLPASEGDE